MHRDPGLMAQTNFFPWTYIPFGCVDRLKATPRIRDQGSAVARDCRAIGHPTTVLASPW